MIAYTDASTAAFAPGESFDDVQEMEEALDRMFRESELEEDAKIMVLHGQKIQKMNRR